MSLEEIIKAFESADQSYIPVMGFNNPHSYRGDYTDLGVEPAYGASVGDMLRTLREALGSTYEGWKGGEYTMRVYSYVHIAAWGNVGDRIGPVLVAYFTGDFSRVPMSYGALLWT